MDSRPRRSIQAPTLFVAGAAPSPVALASAWRSASGKCKGRVAPSNLCIGGAPKTSSSENRPPSTANSQPSSENGPPACTEDQETPTLKRAGPSTEEEAHLRPGDVVWMKDVQWPACMGKENRGATVMLPPRQKGQVLLRKLQGLSDVAELCWHDRAELERLDATKARAIQRAAIDNEPLKAALGQAIERCARTERGCERGSGGGASSSESGGGARDSKRRRVQPAPAPEADEEQQQQQQDDEGAVEAAVKAAA